MSVLIDTALLKIKTRVFTFLNVSGCYSRYNQVFQTAERKNRRNKGRFGEQIVSFVLKLKRRLNQNIYRAMNDVIIPDGAGGITQIDHIVISPYGVFVIETKNMCSWIFGDEKPIGTQVIFKSKNRFKSVSAKL